MNLFIVLVLNFGCLPLSTSLPYRVFLLSTSQQKENENHLKEVRIEMVIKWGKWSDWWTPYSLMATPTFLLEAIIMNINSNGISPPSTLQSPLSFLPTKFVNTLSLSIYYHNNIFIPYLIYTNVLAMINTAISSFATNFVYRGFMTRCKRNFYL